jgi:hypothetical protein
MKFSKINKNYFKYEFNYYFINEKFLMFFYFQESI